MAKSLLIRDVDKESLDWLHSAVPAGSSQGKFLKEIIKSAQEQSEVTEKLKVNKKVSKAKFTFIDLFAGIGGVGTVLFVTLAEG